MLIQDECLRSDGELTLSSDNEGRCPVFPKHTLYSLREEGRGRRERSMYSAAVRVDEDVLKSRFDGFSTRDRFVC